MKTSFLIVAFIFTISFLSKSSCQNKENKDSSNNKTIPYSLSEEEIEDSRNAVHKPFATPLIIPNSKSKIDDIPVNEKNKYYASSTKEIFFPSIVFDYDDKTFWSPDTKVVNEWLAVYIGKLETLGKFTESNLVIWDGSTNLNNGNVEYSKPVKYKIEFYVDENLILEQAISKIKYSGNNGFPGYIESNFDFQNLKHENGILWAKITILEAEKTGSAAIRDIKFSFKNANPFNAYNELSVFCNAVSKQDVNTLSNFTDNPPSEILDQFTSEFVPEDGPGCTMNNFEVHSEDIVSLHAVEGGDGGSRAFFKYDNGKWKLYKYAYFSYF